MRFSGLKFIFLILVFSSNTSFAEPIEPNPVGWSVDIPKEYEMVMEYPIQLGSSGCHIGFQQKFAPFSVPEPETGVFQLRHRQTGRYRPAIVSYRLSTWKVILLPVPEDDDADYFIAPTQSLNQLYGIRVSGESPEVPSLCHSEIVQYSLSSTPIPQQTQLQPSDHPFIQPLVLSATGKNQLLVKNLLEYSEFNLDSFSEMEGSVFPFLTLYLSFYAKIEEYSLLLPMNNGSFQQTSFSALKYPPGQGVDSRLIAAYYMGRQSKAEPAITINQPELSPLYHRIVGWNHQGQLYVSSLETVSPEEDSTDSTEPPAKRLCIAEMPFESDLVSLLRAQCTISTNIKLNEKHYIERVWQGREDYVYVTLGCKDSASECAPYSLYFSNDSAHPQSFRNRATVIYAYSKKPVVLNVWTEGGRGDESIAWYEANGNVPGKISFTTSFLPTCDDLRKLNKDVSIYDECRGPSASDRNMKKASKWIKRIGIKTADTVFYWMLWKLPVSPSED